MIRQLSRCVALLLTLFAAAACGAHSTAVVVPSSTTTTSSVASSTHPTSSTTTTASSTDAIDTTPTVTLGGWTGRKPAGIYFSGDAGNIAYDLTWDTWDDQSAVAHGTRNELSCEPSCAGGTVTPYPVTLTFAEPVNGQFTTVTEVTSDGNNRTETFTSPTWAQGACTTWDPDRTDSCKFA